MRQSPFYTLMLLALCCFLLKQFFESRMQGAPNAPALKKLRLIALAGAVLFVIAAVATVTPFNGYSAFVIAIAASVLVLEWKQS